ncbi:MAG TPA: hypothetical protein VI815_00730 [Candidatus Nanoarchaeia archaeon]|nr:hypothetical protein [Candidatus Nanoarchaeia archaeon]
MSLEEGIEKSEVSKEIVEGIVSLEKWYQFQCGYEDCKKWWAISDANSRDKYFCPLCGRENYFDFNNA